MEQTRIVAEYDKMRRLYADLCHIVDFQAAALVRRRLHASRRILQHVVEHTGGDAHGILVGNIIDELIQLAFFRFHQSNAAEYANLRGGETDTERAANMLLEEYRNCKIGRITLERV